MRVQDTLESLSETTRQAILVEQTRRFGIADEEVLSYRLQDPAFLGQVWDQVGELERRVIKLFITASSRGFFSKRAWERVTAQEHKHLSVGLTKLRRLGLIVTVRKMWSEIGYMMPQEVREQLTEYLLPEPSRGFVSLSKTLPYYISTARGIHLDLFGLLLFIRDHQVPFTQKGSIHRRWQQKMTPLLSLKDEHVKGVVFSLSQQEEREGLSLTIVLDMAIRLGLVHVEERSLVISRNEIRRWLGQSLPERFEELYRLVVENYLPHGGWWEAFAQMMRQVPLEQWCSLSEQMRMLVETGFILPPEAPQLIRDQWLHMLAGLGWVELGMDEEERLFWRWSSLPRLTQEEGWFIDSSGAITIPPLVPLLDVWELSRFCQLQFDGSLIRGEIQARLLQTLLASGWSEEQVVDILRAGCVHPLPEALVEMISQWAKEARQIQLEPCLRVRTAHAGFIEEWKQIPDFQPYLTQILSPTDFLITLSSESTFVTLLRQFGYEPQVLSHSHGPLAASDSREEGQARAGLFAIERPWDGYAVENTFPDQWEGMPQIATLPKMWTQHFQSYHPQSLRDLLKRAIELQLEVEIQRVDKERWQGVPEEVRIETGYWVVTFGGKQGKSRCRLDDIDRVRIVMPEYLY